MPPPRGLLGVAVHTCRVIRQWDPGIGGRCEAVRIVHLRAGMHGGGNFPQP